MPRLLLGATLAWLVAMFSLASPRATGDASEYVAMASNLASGRPPALTAAEMDAFTRRHADLPGGFELTTRRFPELLGPDGRQDMPHMWTYSALAVPGVWAARRVGLPDAWGLVALNVAAFVLLLWLAVRDGAGPWTLLVFAGPFVWWLDKPMADLLIGCLLGISLLSWGSNPGAALAWLGVAAAQNPALGIVWAGLAALSLAQQPARLRDRRWWVGAMVGGLIAASAPAYYLWHLGRLSPLTTYATPHWPSLGSLLFPIVDVNMGALYRFTPGSVAAALALTRRDGWRAAAAWPAVLAAVVLLAMTSQQPNRNNGGHPDLSRYVIWLWPLLLPWVQALDRSTSRTWQRIGVMLLILTSAWTTWQFRPTMPERYRYPTAMASWLWTTHPAWTAPIPEAFAERTSHREPGWAPSATPACEKVLLYEGAWPWACPPATSAPEACRASETYCYANRRADGTYDVDVVGLAPGVRPAVTARRWTHADDVSRWLSRRTAGARDATAISLPVAVRSTSGITSLQTWVTDAGALVIHAHEVRDRARLVLRHPAPLRVRMQQIDGAETVSDVVPGDAPTTLVLPAARDLLIDIRW